MVSHDEIVFFWKAAIQTPHKINGLQIHFLREKKYKSIYTDNILIIKS